MILSPTQALKLKKKKKKGLIDYTKYPECDVLIKHINERFRKGLGTNIFVIGLSGTGKSSTSQRIGELLNESRDNKFQVYIVDSLYGFVRAVRNSIEGDIVVIEEVSVLFPSRRAMSKENVAIGKIFDTVRKKRLCLISNAPIWGSIDSHMRALGNIILETLVIKKQIGVVLSKFHRLQTNPKSGKTYTHTFQRDGRDVKIIYTKMPDKEKWKEYEAQKDKFMEEVYKDLEEEQNKILEKKKNRDGLEKGGMEMITRPLTEFQKNVLQCLKDGITKQKDIASKLGTFQTKVCENIKYMRKKGIYIGKKGELTPPAELIRQ